jgi:uncharacterized protein YciI
MLFHVTGTIPDPSIPAPPIEAELAVSQQLQDEGTTLSAVRRVDGPGVFLIVEAEDLDHARAALGRLPFVAAGVVHLEFAEVTRV